MKIVLIGGGTGLSNLLTGLKDEVGKKIKRLTAIVTVADSGGSSGILRAIYDIPAVGDLRNCLLALSDIENYVKKAMQYRFRKGIGLKGHPLGNLFLVALMETEGNFLKAIKKASSILKVKGEVMPSSLDQIELIAKFEDGKVIKGENEITDYGIKNKKKIVSLRIKPQNPKIPKEVIERIKTADMIVFGPGSLFTSILPNLLIDKIRKAINESKAIKVFIVNLLTQPGETDNFKASDHFYVFKNFSKIKKIDAILINKTKPRKNIYTRIVSENKKLVEVDVGKLKKELIKIYTYDLANKKDIYFKHHPLKLKRAIFKIAKDFGII